MFPIANFLYEEGREIKTDIKNYEELEQLEQLEEEGVNNELDDSLSGKSGIQIVIKRDTLQLPRQLLPVFLEVYWHSTSSNLVLVIENLARLPSGSKYEVWSVYQGNRKSLGLHDAPGNNKLMIIIDETLFTADYEITIRRE